MKIKILFKLIPFAFIIFGCVAVDLLSKHFFVSYFTSLSLARIEVLPFLDFALVENRGVSFSFLANLNYVILSIMIVVTLLFVGLYVAKKFDNFSTLEYYMYAFILGGGLGNIINRVASGVVVDFISVHFFGYYFPVFNFADIFISIAMFIFLYDNFMVKRRKGND